MKVRKSVPPLKSFIPAHGVRNETVGIPGSVFGDDRAKGPAGRSARMNIKSVKGMDYGGYAIREGSDKELAYGMGF